MSTREWIRPFDRSWVRLLVLRWGEGGWVEEEALAGGFVSGVVRVGETVRRPAAPAYTRKLLTFLAERGWPGAPRLLGVDERGRDVVSYLDGDVPWQRERQDVVRTDAALERIATLVRELHDLTAGTDLAGDAEVACHNDLSPKNTVYRDTRGAALPVALLDWDIAGPGRRVHDVAHVCWQFVDLGLRSAPGPAARRVRLVADAYGLADRDELVDAVLWWQDRCWRGIESRAAVGDPAMVRLRDGGAATAVRADHAWTANHRATLDRALR